MINVVYLDNFANEYVLNKEVAAPPERYLEVRRGKEDFIESWQLKNSLIAHLYCNKDSYRERINALREQKENEMKSTFSRMICWEVPEDTFGLILKEMNIKEDAV